MQLTLYSKLVFIKPFSCSSSEGKSLASETNGRFLAVKD